MMCEEPEKSSNALLLTERGSIRHRTHQHERPQRFSEQIVFEPSTLDQARHRTLRRKPPARANNLRPIGLLLRSGLPSTESDIRGSSNCCRYCNLMFHLSSPVPTATTRKNSRMRLRRYQQREGRECMHLANRCTDESVVAHARLGDGLPIT